MESRSFPSSFDIAGRYAKQREQHYLRYEELGIPDAEGPQWQSNSYDRIEKVFSWVYAKKNSESNYNVLDNYRRPLHIPSINGCSDTWERWERRRYNYTNSSFNIDQNPVTNFFMMLLRYAVQIKYETPKRK